MATRTLETKRGTADVVAVVPSTGQKAVRFSLLEVMKDEKDHLKMSWSFFILNNDYSSASARAVDPGDGGTAPGIPGYEPGRLAMTVWFFVWTCPDASR